LTFAQLIEPRFCPGDRIGEFVNLLTKLMDFRRRGQVTAFLLEIFRCAASQRVTSTLAPASELSGHPAELMGDSIANQPRQFFLEIRLGESDQFSKSSGDLRIARDFHAAVTYGGFWVGAKQAL
jgi:hypothetical protein